MLDWELLDCIACLCTGLCCSWTEAGEGHTTCLLCSLPRICLRHSRSAWQSCTDIFRSLELHSPTFPCKHQQQPASVTWGALGVGIASRAERQAIWEIERQAVKHSGWSKLSTHNSLQCVSPLYVFLYHPALTTITQWKALHYSPHTVSTPWFYLPP